MKHIVKHKEKERKLAMCHFRNVRRRNLRPTTRPKVNEAATTVTKEAETTNDSEG
jgi:hypothetical protein